MNTRRDVRGNRSALFDEIEDGGIRASSSYSIHEIDEQENKRAIDGLQDRVLMLKRLTSDIHEEVDGHNRMLDRMFDYRIPTTGYKSCGVGVESLIKMNGLPIRVYAPETVGCVVVDSLGCCAAVTSTGRLMNKRVGRIGDSALIGAGTYASDLCGVSCTGEGEAIIRATLAREVAAVMEYKGLGLQEVVDFVIKERLDEAQAGPQMLL